jgi:hypothetical protein
MEAIASVDLCGVMRADQSDVNLRRGEWAPDSG